MEDLETPLLEKDEPRKNKFLDILLKCFKFWDWPKLIRSSKKKPNKNDSIEIEQKQEVSQLDESNSESKTYSKEQKERIMIYVPQGCVAKITHNTPREVAGLYTFGMDPCTFLVVTNQDRTHLVASHIDLTTNIADPELGLQKWIEEISETTSTISVELHYEDKKFFAEDSPMRIFNHSESIGRILTEQMGFELDVNNSNINQKTFRKNNSSITIKEHKHEVGASYGAVIRGGNDDLLDKFGEGTTPIFYTSKSCSPNDWMNPRDEYSYFPKEITRLTKTQDMHARWLYNKMNYIEDNDLAPNTGNVFYPILQCFDGSKTELDRLQKFDPRVRNGSVYDFFAKEMSVKYDPYFEEYFQLQTECINEFEKKQFSNTQEKQVAIIQAFLKKNHGRRNECKELSEQYM